MTGTLRHLLIAVALLFAQQAAQLHALAHIGRDLARVERGEQNAPPVGHPAEQCLVFHAVGSVLPGAALALEPSRVAPAAIACFVLPFPYSPRIEFDSRAPPLLS